MTFMRLAKYWCVAFVRRGLIRRGTSGDPLCHSSFRWPARFNAVAIDRRPEAVDRLAKNYYGQFIRMAMEGGMEAVARSEHFSECIRARPANRERLLQTDVQHFIKTMSYWRECFLQSTNLPIVGATEADLELNQGAGLRDCRKRCDPYPTDRPESSFTPIPNSELHDNVVERRSDDNLLKEWNRKEWRDAEPRMAEIFASFLRKAENRQV